jgi:hypothetical protein
MESQSVHLPLWPSGVPSLEYLCRATSNTTVPAPPILRAPMWQESLTGEGTQEEFIENFIRPVFQLLVSHPRRLDVGAHIV